MKRSFVVACVVVSVFGVLGLLQATDALAGPRIAVCPMEMHDFGEVAEGVTQTWTLTVSNIGDEGLTITDLSLSGDSDFQMESEDCSGETLLAYWPGSIDSCTAAVSFTPDPIDPQDPKSATLAIQSDDPDRPTSDVFLAAWGNPILTWSKRGAGTQAVCGTSDLPEEDGGELVPGVYQPAEVGSKIIYVYGDGFGERSRASSSRLLGLRLSHPLRTFTFTRQSIELQYWNNNVIMLQLPRLLSRIPQGTGVTMGITVGVRKGGEVLISNTLPIDIVNP